MLGYIYKFINRVNSLFTFFAAGAAILLLSSCVAVEGVNGSLDRDRDLDNRFLDYEVLQDHKYYTSGGYDRPDAIIAIHRDYELDDTAGLWVHFPNVDYWQMRKWIDTIAPEQNYRYSNGYFAAYILDPEGKRIGAWYSIDVFTSVKFLEDNKVLVYTPDVDLNIDLDRSLKGAFL
jgi:hypothetical protein